MEEIKARRCWEFLVIEADQPLFEKHIIGLAVGASGNCELRLRHKNGGIVWVASFAKIVQEPDQPELLHIYGGLVDITARKQAEEALAAHLQFLQLLLDTIPNPIFFKDAQGTYLGCNKAFEDYLGVTRQEIVGKSVYDLSPRELADEYHRMDLEALQTTGTQVYESRVQAADGARRHVVFHKATFPDPNGGVGGLVGIITDITARKQAEEALVLHATRLQALLDLHLLAQAPQEQILDFVMESSVKVTQSEYCWVGLLDETESLLTIHAWSQGVMAQCTVADKPIQFPIVPEMGLWGECLRQRTAVLCNDYQAPHPGKKGLPEGHVPIRRFLAVPVMEAGRVVTAAAVANKGKDYTEDDIRAFTSLVNKMWEILRRRQAEEALRESEQRFRLMAETIQDVFWMATPEIGKMVYVSPAYEQVWGRTCQELYQSPQVLYRRHPSGGPGAGEV